MPNLIIWSVVIILYYEGTTTLSNRIFIDSLKYVSIQGMRSVDAIFNAILSRLVFQLKFALVNQLRYLTIIRMRFSRNFNMISLKFLTNYETEQGVYTCSDRKSLFVSWKT